MGAHINDSPADIRELQYKLIVAIHENDIETARDVLSQDFPIDFICDNSTNLNDFLKHELSPANFAAWMGREEILGFILRRKPDLSIADAAGDTPLHNAMRAPDNQNVIRMLLEAGADKHVKNNKGELPAQITDSADYSEILDSWVPKIQTVFNRYSGSQYLQEVYHFDTLERITYVLDGRGGKVQAFIREDFASIARQPQLREAYEAHLQRGGTTEPEKVFGGNAHIIKPLRRDVSGRG